MTKIKNILGLILIGCISVMFSSCKDNNKTNEKYFYKYFHRVKSYDSKIPLNYKYTDFTQIAKSFDEIIFDFDAKGEFLPLVWEDTTNQSIGISAYVGDHRINNDGTQEAVTVFSSILSDALIDHDTNKRRNFEYLNYLDAFFSIEEGVILNNPDGSSRSTSMWYMLYPAILYTHLSYFYDAHDTMRKNVLTNIESWYEAYSIMFDDGNPNFEHTGFDFVSMQPYNNHKWKEPDSAVGIAVLLYCGYELTNDEKYLKAVINLMDYIEGYFGSPLYEILMYFAPAMALKLNTIHGKDYNVTKSLNRIFDGAAIPRGGWGSIVGQWGDYDMTGLFGSTSDGGGYAFSMNTFAAAASIAPLVKYDARYSNSIGQWMLHLVSNSRYFYAGESNIENQSTTYLDGINISENIKNAVPYEGIRKSHNGKSPWIGGDPTVYGWGQTDFSLYSGSHIGLLASMVETTNIEAILKLDLIKTYISKESTYPTFLLYNPYENSNSVEYLIASEGIVDLYDTVRNTIIANDVTDTTTIEIPGNSSVVIVEIPQNSEIEFRDNKYFVNDIYISSNRSTLNIINHDNNEKVSGRVILQLLLSSNYIDEIIKTVIAIDEKTLSFHTNEKIVFNTRDFEKGSKKIEVFVETREGFQEYTSIRLKFD